MDVSSLRTKKMRSVEIIVPLVFLVVGIVFICVSIGVRANYNKKVKECTSVTVGKIVEWKKVTSRMAGENTSVTNYFPVYEYYANGNTITVKSAIGKGKPGEVGEKVEIYYSPNNPEKYYVNSGDRKVIIWVFGLVGVISFIVAIGVFVIILTH